MTVASDQLPVTNKQVSVDSGQRWQRARDFFTHVIVQPRILRKTYPGIMHFMLVHGVFIQVIGTLINLLNMALFQPWVIEWPRLGWYLGYELVMDMAGVMILIGVGMAAFRRYILQPESLESNWDDGFALIMLTLIVLVGYTNEATRFLSTSPQWMAWSPVGNWLAGVLAAARVSPQQAAAWHDAAVYIHATLAMALATLSPRGGRERLRERRGRGGLRRVPGQARAAITTGTTPASRCQGRRRGPGPAGSRDETRAEVRR